MIDIQSPSFIAGLEQLRTPLVPLARIVHFLYLTGPFEQVEQILDELHEPVEMETAVYADPGARLRPHLEHLQLLEKLKQPTDFPLPLLLDEGMQPVDRFDALDLLMNQGILEQELEQINSLLCGPCGCTLCCVGPDKGMAQEFFEIPLQPQETGLFTCPGIDTATSRQSDLYAVGPPTQETTTLYHWQRGWSLVMPQGCTCPNLDQDNRGCRIYTDRPTVCRKPQIFPYLLERSPEHDQDSRAAFLVRRKLLAVWDCPYVRELQETIGAYAQLCGLEPVFANNKR